MTVQEIHKEVFEDIRNLKNKLEELKNEFRKAVLDGNRFPLTKTYDYKTSQKKNLFSIVFTALKRSDWKRPIINLFGIYSRPEGKYAIVPSIDLNLISIFPPHFFKRYRERIVKDLSMSNEGIIRQYFKDDWGFMGAVVNEDYKSVFYDFENDNKDEKVSFVAVTSIGFCFGEKQGNVNVMKTIISEDMLFESQKFIFSELRKAFIAANRERYGGTI